MMKSKTTSLLLAMLVGVSLLAGCSSKPKAEAPITPTKEKVAAAAKDAVKVTHVAEASEPIDYLAKYDSVLENILNHLMLGTDPVDGPDELMGILEYNKANGFNTSYTNLGYTLKDISGDNIPELLVGDTPQGNERQTLYMIYGLKNDTPQLRANGHYRMAYHLLDNNEILMTASEGAASSIYGTYKLDFHGEKLNSIIYRFSAINAENNRIEFYQNFYGKFDKSISEQITPNDFEALEEKLLNRIVKLPLTAFSEYEKAKQATKPYVIPTITHAQAVIGDVPDFIRHDVINSQYSIEIAIVSQQPLSDFKLLKLTYRDSNDGKVHFATQTLYTVRELTLPFITSVDFPGSIPQYGISFVDKKGNAHQYSINQSGKDDSLQLIEFE